jgi:hypothetical protein
VAVALARRSGIWEFLPVMHPQGRWSLARYAVLGPRPRQRVPRTKYSIPGRGERPWSAPRSRACPAPCDEVVALPLQWSGHVPGMFSLLVRLCPIVRLTELLCHKGSAPIGQSDTVGHRLTCLLFLCHLPRLPFGFSPLNCPLPPLTTVTTTPSLGTISPPAGYDACPAFGTLHWWSLSYPCPRSLRCRALITSLRC